jgi:hypothetical protein
VDFEFDILCLQKIATCEKDIFTAPVFRSKPDIDAGFLHGGFWKYNAKPSNIMAFSEDIVDDEIEGKHTIQDDIAVASQDFAAGLVRMGILHKMRYLLEVSVVILTRKKQHFVIKVNVGELTITSTMFYLRMNSVGGL